MDEGINGAIHDILTAAFISSITRKIWPQYLCILKGDYDELFFSTSKLS